MIVMKHVKLSIFLSFLCLGFLIFGSYAVYTSPFQQISDAFQIADSVNYGAEEEGDSYMLSLSVTNPTATTYPDGADNIPVEVEDTGNGTNTVITYNFQHSNGTWLFGSNQTYTVPIDVTIQEYRNSTWTFSVHGINDELVEDYEEVEFNVQYLTAYTLSITGTGVSNTTITIDSQAWSATSSGNETNPAWQIELLYANRSVAVANSSSASGTWSSLVNGTSYIACFSVIGDNEASDYEEVMFTYEVIDTYTNAISEVTPLAQQYNVSSVSWGFTLTSNDTGLINQTALYWINGTQIGVNQTGVSGTWTSLGNGTYIQGISVTGEHSSSYETVEFTVEIIIAYSLSLSDITPANTTSTSGTVSWGFTLTTNTTNLVNQTALYHSGNMTQIGSNSTLTSGTYTGLLNGTYLQYITVTGDNDVSDRDQVIFTVEIITADGVVDYAAVAVVAFAVVAAATIAFAWRRIRRPTVRTSGILRMYDPYGHILLFGVTRL